MRHIFLFLLLIIGLSSIQAQSPTRIKLTQLEQSKTVEGSKAGQIPLSNSAGDLRYAQYVEVDLAQIGFVPTYTGNTSNYSEFVVASDSTRWYIDWQGRGFPLDVGGSGPDKNGYYGGNGGNGGDGTIPSVTRSTLTNQLTFYRVLDNSGGLVPIRIQVDSGNESDFMSFRQSSDSMLINRSDQEFQISSTTGLNLVADDVVALIGDSLQFSGVLNESGTGKKTFITLKSNDRVKKQLGINEQDLNFTIGNGIYGGSDTIGGNAYAQFDPTVDNSRPKFMIGHLPNMADYFFPITGRNTGLFLDNQDGFWGANTMIMEDSTNSFGGKSQYIMNCGTQNNSLFGRSYYPNGSSYYGANARFGGKEIDIQSTSLMGGIGHSAKVWLSAGDSIERGNQAFFAVNDASDPAKAVGIAKSGNPISIGQSFVGDSTYKFFVTPRSLDGSNQTYYHSLRVDLPSDTTLNTVSLYNRRYYFPNDTPSTAVGDTMIMAWAGNGAGTDPLFVPLPTGGGGYVLANQGLTMSGDTVQLGHKFDGANFGGIDISDQRIITAKSNQNGDYFAMVFNLSDGDNYATYCAQDSTALIEAINNGGVPYSSFIQYEESVQMYIQGDSSGNTYGLISIEGGDIGITASSNIPSVKEVKSIISAQNGIDMYHDIGNFGSGFFAQDTFAQMYVNASNSNTVNIYGDSTTLDKKAVYTFNQINPTVNELITRKWAEDSLNFQPLISGTVNQTLRFSGTDQLQATSQIYNDGNRVSIGTTTLPTGYELYVQGDFRANKKAYFGDAIGVTNANATLAVNDTTAGGSIVYFANRRNTTSAPMDLTLYARHSASDSRYHVANGSTETQWNWGLDASESKYKFSTDAGGTLETSTVYTILPNNGSLLPGNIGIQVDAPTARMHFAAQVNNEANSAPIKLTMGNPLNTVEDGALEYVNTGVDDLTFSVGTDRFILGKCLVGSAALDFGNLNPTISEALAITVTGVQPLDQCILGRDPAINQNGINYEVFVQAANTVRVVATNMSGVAIDLASGVYTVRCFH